MQRNQSDLGQHIEFVARALLGEPNRHLSSKNDLRFGAHGSMSVNPSKGTAYSHEDEDGGGVLWLIQREAGLTGAEAFEYLKEIGCEVEDRREQSAPKAREAGPERAPEQPPQLIKCYDYINESGEVLFQVCRYEPKTFRQRRPDSSEPSGWSYKVAGVTQVPYRLPEIAEAIAQGRPIFFVEGEKDVESLAKIGVPATCNAGGAGKWYDELTPYFRDADVVILPDNDPQSSNGKTGELKFYPADHAEFSTQPIHPGQDHAELVARRISGAARRIRVLALPGLPSKGDVSDWVEAGGTAEQLYALADKTPSWHRRPSRIESKFGGMRWEDIGSSAAAIEAARYGWVVEDIIPFSDVTLMFGDSGSGKSFNLFDLSMCVARGIKFAGKNVERGLVVYVAAEAGKGFVKRKQAYVEHHDIADEFVPFYLCTKRPDFFASDDDVKTLVEEIKLIAATYDLPLVLTVLDTLSALAPGMNEIASADVTLVRRRIVRLKDELGCAVILVHHKPKNGNGPRGHTSLTGDYETTIELEKTDSTDSRNNLIRKATVRKQREGKDGLSWQFTLPIVQVGLNKWGNPETSCVSMPYVHPTITSRQGYTANNNERLFLRALWQALNDNPITSRPMGVPESVKTLVEWKTVRDIMRKQNITESEDDTAKNEAAFRKAFAKAGERLREAGVIGVVSPLVWYTGRPVKGMSYRVEEPKNDAA